MGDLVVYPTGDVFLHATNGTPTLVGAAPQWGDDSDASYAIITGRYYTGTDPDFSDRARTSFPATADVSAAAPAAYIRTRMRAEDERFPLKALIIAGGGVVLGEAASSATTTTSWVDWPIVADSDSSLGEILSRLKTEGIEVEYQGVTGVVTSGIVDTTWTIYESRIVVPRRPGLHPCRQVPRADGLAASSARRTYPPDKSLQASPRHAGVYW